MVCDLLVEPGPVPGFPVRGARLPPVTDEIADGSKTGT
jgi:hypothetical protein